MTPAAAGLRLASSRRLRRLAGCGCAGLVGLVALPVLVILATAGGLLSWDGAGSGQADTGVAGVVAGAGEPLPPGTFRVSQGFGCTAIGREPPPPAGEVCPPDGAHPTFTRFHTGIDLAAADGVVASAVTAGTVRIVESTGGFGLHILLTATAAGDAVVMYLYGHLSGAAVADGAVVRAGDPIGFVGSTGNSSGPHLHFEVDVGGRPVNPCAVFPPGYLRPPGVAAAGCLAAAL